MKARADYLGYIRVPFNYRHDSDDLDEYKYIDSMKFPEGWTFYETYITPIMSVIVFECDHFPTDYEIQLIEDILTE